MGGGAVGGPGLGAGGVVGPGANAAAQAQQFQRALQEGHALVKLKVPNADVGLVIGRGGATIRQMQERSGANIQIPPGPDSDDPASRTVSVTHPQQEGAEFAQRLIEEVLKGRVGGAGGGGGSGGGVGVGGNHDGLGPDVGGGMGGGGGAPRRPGEIMIQIQVRRLDRIPSGVPWEKVSIRSTNMTGPVIGWGEQYTCCNVEYRHLQVVSRLLLR